MSETGGPEMDGLGVVRQAARLGLLHGPEREFQVIAAFGVNDRANLDRLRRLGPYRVRYLKSGWAQGGEEYTYNVGSRAAAEQLRDKLSKFVDAKVLIRSI
jgi:hypothetical protein